MEAKLSSSKIKAVLFPRRFDVASSRSWKNLKMKNLANFILEPRQIFYRKGNLAAKLGLLQPAQ